MKGIHQILDFLVIYIFFVKVQYYKPYNSLHISVTQPFLLTLTHSLSPLGVADVAALRLLVGGHVADAAAAVVQTDGLGALHSHGLRIRYGFYIFFLVHKLRKFNISMYSAGTVRILVTCSVFFAPTSNEFVCLHLSLMIMEAFRPTRILPSDT